MAEFLRSYSPKDGPQMRLSKGATRSLIDNLRQKTNLPAELRALLGERKGETEGVNNLFRTFNIVSSMVARQSYYNNIIELGRVQQELKPDGTPVLDKDGIPVRTGFIYTAEELATLMK